MPSPTVRYEATQGYGASYFTTITNVLFDMSGNNNHATINNMSANSNWLPNQRAGLIKMDNQSNTGNKTIQSPSSITHGNNYSVHIGFQWIQMNGFPCVICGAYASSTHDWWLGVNTNGDFLRFSRNGVAVISSATTMAANAYYMVGLTNDFTNNTTIFKIWKLGGTDTVATSGTAYAASTAGRLGICKYGGFTDNYTPYINFGHLLWWNNAALSLTELNDISDRYRGKYGI